MKITHLFDNISLNPDVHALWGYSLLVEKDGQKILMDTGSNGRMLLNNMKRLEVDPAAINYLFISHRHWDHIGGLDSILELNPNVQLVVPHSLSNHLLKDLRDYGHQVTVVDEDPVEISEGVFSTGTLGGSEPNKLL